MAARVTTVNPAGGADQVSYSAAEAVQQGIGANLVSAGDTVELRAVGTWSASDTTVVTVSGFTTGVSNWIMLATDSANRWLGEAWNTAKARIVVNSGSGVVVASNNYVFIVGLQIENTGTGSGIRTNNVGTLVDACQIRARRGAHLNNAAATLAMRNCLGCDGGTQVMRQLVHAEISGCSARVYASTYAGTGSSSTECGFEAETGTTLILTNIIGNDTTAGAVIIGGAGTITQSYCATSDASASGTGAIASAAFTFVNAAGGDYRIDVSDTSGVIGSGTDLSADANLEVDEDAGQQARPAAPTRGMWEAAPAGGAGAVDPAGIASAEAFGTAKLVASAVPSGIATAEAHGTQKLTAYVAPGAVASLEAAPSPILAPTGSASLAPGAVGSLEDHGSQVLVATGEAPLLASSAVSGEAHGSTTVAGSGAVEVLPSAIASAEAHGSTTVAAAGSTLVPDAMASAEAHGTTTLAGSGTATLAPSPVASAEAHGAQVLAASGDAVVAPSAIASAEAHGATVVAAAGTILMPTGITTAEAHGTQAVVAAGAASLAPSSVASAEDFGAARLIASINALSLGSDEAHGATILVPHLMALAIQSGEDFGLSTLSGDMAFILAFGIESLEAFGVTIVGDIPVPPPWWKAEGGLRTRGRVSAGLRTRHKAKVGLR